MDILQIALVFLILLLSIFLAITGLQVFFILRDLKKTLDRFNQDEVVIKKELKPNKKRFFRKTL